MPHSITMNLTTDSTWKLARTHSRWANVSTAKIVYPTPSLRQISPAPRPSPLPGLPPGFRGGPLFEDAAVLELSSPVTLGPHVQPICLPEEGQRFDGLRCVASGWGKEDFDGQYGNMSNLDHTWVVTVIHKRYCEKMIRYCAS